MRRWLPWVGLVVILGAALAIGAHGSSRPTLDQRVRHLAAEIKCPVCEGQSVADSDAAPSRAIRDEIRRRMLAGEPDTTVRAYLVSRYGTSALLRPPASGLAALVWVLPVLVFFGAGAAVASTFLRRRRRHLAVPSADDRALVEGALGP